MSAFYMERLLNQNTYQAKQARYRGLKPIATNENDRKLLFIHETAPRVLHKKSMTLTCGRGY